MNDLLARLRAFVEALGSRERRILAAVTAMALFTLLFFGVLDPLLSAVDRSAARARQAQDNLDLAVRLELELAELSGRVAAAERRIEKAPPENLRATLDRLRIQAQIAKFDSIDEKATKTGERYRETTMQVVLKSVSLTQVVNYLQAIERAPQPLTVKRLRISTRADDREQLDVSFLVSTFERA